METFLGINETPTALDRSITNATNRKNESVLLNVEAQEASQNTDYEDISGIYITKYQGSTKPCKPCIVNL